MFLTYRLGRFFLNFGIADSLGSFGIMSHDMHLYNQIIALQLTSGELDDTMIRQLQVIIGPFLIGVGICKDAREDS